MGKWRELGKLGKDKVHEILNEYVKQEKIKNWKYISTESGYVIAIVFSNNRQFLLRKRTWYRGSESLFTIEDVNTAKEARKIINKVLDNTKIITKLCITDLEELDDTIWQIKDFMFEDNLSEDEAIEKTAKFWE